MLRFVVPVWLGLLAACTWGAASPSAPSGLFESPSAQEIAAADAWWNSQTLTVSNIVDLGTTSLVTADASYDVTMIGYDLNGSHRCGAVLTPSGRLTVTVLDHSDIAWDYPPRDISRGAHISQVLGERAPRAAILVPCFRGMTLRVNDLQDTAEGDRSDAWSGASLDARAFLTVALEHFARLPREIVAYGYSRGGGVAMLTGERDGRIDRVAAFAAPSDFLAAMIRDDPDWTQQLRDRAANGNPPADDRAYQYVDWFFTGAESDAEIRQRMLRASPFYFLDRLPTSTLYHGGADRPVPRRNAEKVAQWAEEANRHDITVRIYEGAPHLLNQTDAYVEARHFIVPDGQS